jgi:hypothetical protein
MKDFVPYSEALVLNILGFDEPCFGYYDSEGLQPSDGFWWNRENKNSLFVEPEKTNNPKISAPLYQQAFRWFREKHDLISYVHPLALLQDTKKWCYEITNFESSWDEDSDLHTPEEAELACLQKLIEIVKNK